MSDEVWKDGLRRFENVWFHSSWSTSWVVRDAIIRCRRGCPGDTRRQDERRATRVGLPARFRA